MSTPPKSRLLSAGSLRSYGLPVALLIVWLLFAYLTDGIFLSPRNFSNLIRQSAVLGVLSVGMLMIIIAGQIDLSVGSIAGLSGMAAVLVQASAHWGLLPSLLTGLGVGLAIGALQGFLVAYVEIPSFIVTLGGLLVWRGLAKGLSGGNTYPVSVRPFKVIGQAYLGSATGVILMIAGILATIWLVMRQNRAAATQGTPWPPLKLLARILVPCALIVGLVLALNEYAGVPVPLIVLLVVGLGAAYTTQQTTIGRVLFALGGNPAATKATPKGAGTNPRRPLLSAFCMLGMLAAVAGIIYTAQLGSAGPDAGTLFEIDAIAACILGGASLKGGRGTVLGACLGALFMASLDNGMSLKDVPDFLQEIVKGGILVAAVGLDRLDRHNA